MQLYYRARKDGAQVFRMEIENRQRRLELRHIATINARGEILAHKHRKPTEAEEVDIAAWWADFKARRDAGALTDTETAIAGLHAMANWLQKDASQAEVEAASDPLLMAMHDLRQVIVRRLSQAADDD